MLSIGAGFAQAQTATDDSLTWHGITLYGIVDIGLQNQTHGAPISDYFVGGSAEVVQKNSNHAVTGVTPSNLSNSRIGLQGLEPLVGDWSGVFKLETFFNPQSGQISDALKSLAQNNGRPLGTQAEPGNQNTNVDSSASGQTFIQSYAGVSSKTFGTITFGRQNTVLADGVAKYDPNYASQAFSLIGISGTTAGGGDTQNRRLDSSVKYVGNFKPAEGVGAHLSAEYKFNQSTGSANTAYEVSFGGDFAGLSLDAYYAKINDAVALAALSSAQVATLSRPNTDPESLCPSATVPPTPGATCIAASASNALAATISDNTAIALMGLYNMGVLKFFGGYEHIKYANPDNPLKAGFDVAAYRVAFVNKQSGVGSTYFYDKTLQVAWAGVRYTVIPELDLVGAWYGYKQNAFGTAAANAECSSSKPHLSEPGTCGGTENVISFDGIYRLSKRFDAFAGVMYSGVRDGLAGGFPYSTTDITTTVGVRFKF
ncbi:MAG TPA: porin [Steroidobacteraceae bacterium]|jgi:predicted porin|nr:porin [Steroidobacteraceae bacterium]